MTPKPQTVCRCCGKPMDAAYQPALLANRDGYWLVTCWQQDCKLAMYTFLNNSYPTMDLADYFKTKHSASTLVDTVGV